LTWFNATGSINISIISNKGTKKLYKNRLLRFSALVLVVQLLLPALVVPAFAAPFTQAFLRLDRVQASVATGGRVCADPVTTATEDEVQVVFPTGFTVNATAANWTVDTSNLDAGQTAWVGIGTATAVSGQTVTFPSGNLTETGTTLYCFNFTGTSTLTNNSAGDSQTGTIRTRAAAATVDSTDYAVSIIADDNIQVTATVPPTFVLSIPDVSDVALGNLAPNALTQGSARNVSVTTNASQGWVVWVKNTDRGGAGQGLRSSTAAYTIVTRGVTTDDTPTSITESDSDEDYQLDVNLITDNAGGTGTLTIDAEYNGSDVDCTAPTLTCSGGTFARFFEPVASSSGTTDGDTIALVVKANIKGSTPAATDYTDVMTIVAAGRF
jgi:hypothetical protein